MPKDSEGYAGKLLRVDLAREKISDFNLDEKTTRNYLGGTAIGSKILYDEVSPKIDFSDSENRLTIASGPLGGTSIAGSGTISIVTKGALTGGASACQANGFFGAFLRLCGYDGIIFQGSAKRWMYLHVDDGVAELKDASHLLRRDTYETADLIKAEHGKQDLQMSVVSIGPAGENQVRFAGIFMDKGHSASHNGIGAVMGSKKLKAIAVARGKGPVKVSDAKKLLEIATKLRDDVKGFSGTVNGVYRSQTANTGTLPIKNYTTNVWEIPADKLNGFSEEYIRKTFEPKPHACFACSLNHSTMMKIPYGPYKDMIVEEPEYEQLAAWGPVIDLKEIDLAFMLSGTTDRVGLENNESGWLMGWLMECYQKGLIKKSDLDGIEMTWGNAEAVKQLLYLIANNIGCGERLAEGVMRASQKIGGEAAKAAIYTMKGNTPRGHDHRTRWTEMFDTVTSNTGTLETGAMASTKELTGPGYPTEVSTFEANMKGDMVFEDSLGVCRFNTRSNMPLLSVAVAAVTGWNFPPEEAKNVGLRSVNLMRAFNIRCGITKEKDYPSERYGSTPIDGPSKGVSVKPVWDAMLKNYYSILGWDPATGKPTKKTLESLGLQNVIKDLY
ncbi:MAG: Aldehyde ferredoxin oxidoreductase [Thermoproteota archaeon]|nr:Aldehyde ferredoxin oxidoreductase [Thermoproteota archaeon]